MKGGSSQEQAPFPILPTSCMLVIVPFSAHSFPPPFPTPGWILRPFYNLLDKVTEPGRFPQGILVDMQ